MAKFKEDESVYIVGDEEFEWRIDEVVTVDWKGNPLEKPVYNLRRYDDGSYYSPMHYRVAWEEWEIHRMTLAERVARIEEVLNLE